MRQPAPEARNRFWLTDIREHPTGEDKLYLCANEAVARRGGATVLDRCQWATRDELRAGLITWIERTYHRRRRQDRLSRLTPIEYALIMDHTPAHAA